MTAAAYQLTQQNVLTTDPNHPDFQTQTGEVRVRGFELEAHADLTDNLSLVAAYTYMDPVNTKSNDTGSTISGDTESTQGKRPVELPRNIASVWANYEFHDGPAAGFGLGGGIRYIGSSAGDPVNSFFVPSVTLFDAALHYDLGKINPVASGLKLQVNATNLFDKRYVTGCTNVPFCHFGYRRAVYATLRYQW